MYDKESIYDEKINPLMAQIIEICKEHDIKMFATFYLKESTESENDMYCTTNLNQGDNQSEKILDLYNVAYNGYVVQKPYFAAITVIKEG